MKYQNSLKQAILPLIIVGIFIVGIYLGQNLNPYTVIQQHNNFKTADKVSVLLNYIQQEYVDTISREGLNEDIIPKLLADLDPHSVYIPASDVSMHNEPLEGNFEGIGIQFNMVNDTLVVLHVIPTGPSEIAGLLQGDRIISVDDVSVAGKGLESDDIIKKLKGKRQTKVRVGVKRQNNSEILFFTIVRDKIPLFSVDASFVIDKYVGYVKVSKFARTTHDEFIEAVTNLKKESIKYLILDLRGNSGGYMESAINIADEFLNNRELIVYTQGKARSKTEYFATPGGVCTNIVPIILIDSWSASASEIVAGALQDNDIGTIIGRRSFGKGLVQEPIFFSDGSVVRLTVARYYTPAGRCIQKPYTKDLEKYEWEIHDRMVSGELNGEQNINFADSLKFKTSKGKTVYGGGGIMPDIYVGTDTSFYSKYFKDLSNQGIVYRFALEYADLNRSKMSSIKNVSALSAYLRSQNALQALLVFASKNKVPMVYADFEKSKYVIENQLFSFIGRIVLDENAYVAINKNIDPILLKAIEKTKL